MPLNSMEHFFVMTDDIDRTRDFYCDILGLSVGFRPELSFPGYWLYLGEIPVVHIGEQTSYADYVGDPALAETPAANGSGMVEHIAFNASGYDQTEQALDAAGLGYRRNYVEDIGLKQIFVKDPNGVCIELNFREAGED